jgi:hypothetical protein
VPPRAGPRPPSLSGVPPLRRAAARAPVLPARALWRADPVRVAAVAASSTPQRRLSRPAARKPVLRLPLLLWTAEAPPAGGGGGGGGSGGGSAGVASVAALYLLLQTPAGVAVRRRRTGQAPRSRVDDVPTSPG